MLENASSTALEGGAQTGTPAVKPTATLRPPLES